MTTQLILADRNYNRAIASRRASVERVIAHLKNWKLPAHLGSSQQTVRVLLGRDHAALGQQETEIP